MSNWFHHLNQNKEQILTRVFGELEEETLENIGQSWTHAWESLQHRKLEGLKGVVRKTRGELLSSAIGETRSITL